MMIKKKIDTYNEKFKMGKTGSLINSGISNHYRVGLPSSDVRFNINKIIEVKRLEMCLSCPDLLAL